MVMGSKRDPRKSNTPAKDADGYIAAAPPHARATLEQMRRVIRAAAPEAEETISYGMPAYRLNEPLVYFGAAKNHCGFYPAGYTVLDAYAEEVRPYRASKGTLRFTYDAPLPTALIEKIVKERVKENDARAAKKKTARAR